MRFYELTHPQYEADFEARRANPIVMQRDAYLPAVTCPACNHTWIGSRRLYVSIDNPNLVMRLRGQPLPLREWAELAKAVKAATNLPEGFELRPGDTFNLPKAELVDARIPPIMHPFPGRLIMRCEVMDALRNASVIGVDFLPVEVTWSKKVRDPSVLPELYEAQITANAWRIGVDRSKIVACDVCGRIVFLLRGDVGIDEATWNGADFCNVDENPNIVVVTERICELLSAHRFSNWACYGPFAKRRISATSRLPDPSL